MIINEEGTYTLRYTATDNCGKTTEVERELVVERPTVFGIRSTSASSSVCQRTDAAARFSDPIPQHSDGNGGWVGGSSPFDDIMPWSGIEVVEDASAGTLVKIPKYWYKWSVDGEEMQLQISNEEKDDFLVSPAHANRGDGVGERDFVYVGRYHNVSNYKSQTGSMPLVNKPKFLFRNSIHELGSDIYMFDIAMYWTIVMLYLVEFADWNSQAKIGGGCSTNGSLENNGLTDGMTYHTGTTNTVVGATNYGHIQYRHIEDLWANVSDFIEGMNLVSANKEIGIIQNPSSFSDYDGTVVGVFSGIGYTRAFNVPQIAGYEYCLLPSTGDGNENRSRTHDEASSSASDRAFIFGGSYESQDQLSGLLHITSRQYNATYTYVGTRLMKLPNA